MSKGKQASKKKSKKTLEQRVGGASSNSKNSKGNYQSKIEYNQSSGYNSQKTNKKNKKKGPQSPLEKIVTDSGDSVEQLAQRLVSKGMSKSDAYKLASNFYAGQKRESNYKLHLDIPGWFKIMNKYMKEGKVDIARLIKTGFQLFLGLTDLPDASRNGYKDIETAIAEGQVPTIFLTGLWGVPANIKFLEKYSGKKMVYLNTTSEVVVKHFVELIKQKTGYKPDFFAFSDGAEVAKNYTAKYGFSDINQIYAVGAVPLEFNPGRSGDKKYQHSQVTYCVEGSAVITPLEQRWKGVLKLPHIELPGYDHLSFFYEKGAAKAIGKIMDNGPKRNSFVRTPCTTAEDIALNSYFERAKQGPFDFRDAA